jgi:biotin synthase-like enzyme
VKNKYIIPIFVPHLGCPNDCTFCNQRKISGQMKNITENDVREIQTVLATDIYRNKMRLETYEKYAHINADLVEEVLGIKEYIGQLTKAKFYIDFIMLMVEESELSYSRSSEICCAVQ